MKLETDFNNVKEAVKANIPFKSGETIIVKLHFGEPGNANTFEPKFVKKIVDGLLELGIKPILFDSLVMYHSPRNSVEGYYKVLEDKGFTKDKMGCDVKVSDEFVNVQMEHLNIEVCKDLVEADGILVLSHVKGHPCAGFGGAIKNLGMGGVTKKSKKDIHVGAKPIVNDKCVACGVCKNVCPANAIEIKEISEVDLDKCWGCSLCIMKCPHEAMTPKVELFDTLLAEGAAAVVKSVKKTYYINVLKNIAKWCDCFDITSDKISEDVGILFSEDVVEIDRKSLDLIKEKNGKDVFLEHNNHDPYLQVNAMEQFLK